MYPKIENHIHKIVDYYKQRGLIQFLKHILEKLGFEHFSRTLIFIVLDTKDITYEVEIPYSFHVATIEDIRREPENYFQHEYLFTKREIIERLKLGHRLFVFKENNKMVYFLWVEQKYAAVDVLRLPLHIPKHVAYISGGFTMPDFRNRGIAVKAKRQIFHYLKQGGIKTLLGVVHPANVKALEIDKKIGFREYQIVNYKRYWHVRRYIVQKYNSNENKIFTTLFRAPKDIWKIYL